MIPWWDVTEAAAAAAELFDVRCAATCRGLHSLVFTDRLGIHVRKIVGHTRRRPSTSPPSCTAAATGG